MQMLTKVGPVLVRGGRGGLGSGLGLVGSKGGTDVDSLRARARGSRGLLFVSLIRYFWLAVMLCARRFVPCVAFARMDEHLRVYHTASTRAALVPGPTAHALLTLPTRQSVFRPRRTADDRRPETAPPRRVAPQRHDPALELPDGHARGSLRRARRARPRHLLSSDPAHLLFGR
jgi:hypothetical protein